MHKTGSAKHGRIVQIAHQLWDNADRRHKRSGGVGHPSQNIIFSVGGKPVIAASVLFPFHNIRYYCQFFISFVL
jgi:hypothetical protein